MQDTGGQETASAKLLRLLGMSSVAGVLVALIALPAVGSIGLTARDGANSFDGMKTTISTQPPPEKTVVYGADGAPIATFFDEYRESVRLDQISEIMQKAIVAIEDSRFYQHGALDLKGAMRALVTNTQAGATRQGGSSLTQQYVKNLLLENAKTAEQERAVTAPTIGRKLRELRYALDIEKRMTKKQILEGYLNVAYFGAGAYGVQAAAKRYFDTTAARLTLPQAALLAGVTNSPVAFDPTLHPQAAKRRRDTVLYRMAQLGVIPQAAAAQAASQPIRLNQQLPKGGCEVSKSPFFCEYVRYEMLGILSKGRYWRMKPAQQADVLRRLKRGGWTIRTTFDKQAQAAAEKALATETSPDSHKVGAEAMVEPGTGKVKAIAASKDFGTGSSETTINIAADAAHGGGVGVSAGSTFKVFTLMAALDQGIPVSTKIPSPAHISIGGYKPCRYTGVFDGHRYKNAMLGGGRWSPSNAGDSEKGTFDLKKGTWESVNTFYAQLEKRIGVCDAVKMAQNFGMERADGNPLVPVPSQVLGTNEIDMVHLAAAYAGIAARGKYCSPIAITEVTDPTGKQLKLPKQDCHQAVDQSLADETTSILRGVLTKGTAKKVPSVGRPAAGKTGTCEEFSCAVFAGYTPNLAAAVAYWDLRGPFNHKVYGVYGATIPGPIWARSMRYALSGRPAMSFREPTDTYGDLNTVEIPDVKGESVGAAKSELAAAGFTTNVAATPVVSDQPKGTVAYTSPTGGSNADDGSNVLIYISDGSVRPTP